MSEESERGKAAEFMRWAAIADEATAAMRNIAGSAIVEGVDIRAAILDITAEQMKETVDSAGPPRTITDTINETFAVSPPPPLVIDPTNVARSNEMILVVTIPHFSKPDQDMALAQNVLRHIRLSVNSGATIQLMDDKGEVHDVHPSDLWGKGQGSA